MSRRRIPDPTRMTLNLAPMVDVMMCLIIFFLLGSRLVAEQYHRIELPVAHAAREIDRDELGQRIVVNIRAPRAPSDADQRPPTVAARASARLSVAQPPSAVLGPQDGTQTRTAHDTTNAAPTSAEYVLHGWDGQQIREYVLDEAGVVDYLRRRAARQSRGDPPLRCVIRADRDVPYGRVEAVMRGCGLAGISRVVFSAQSYDQAEAAGAGS